MKPKNVKNLALRLSVSWIAAVALFFSFAVPTAVGKEHAKKTMARHLILKKAKEIVSLAHDPQNKFSAHEIEDLEDAADLFVEIARDDIDMTGIETDLDRVYKERL